MTAPHVPIDEHACDLCARYRVKQPRNMGVKFLDGFWACAECIEIYLRRLRAGSKVDAAA